MGMFTKDGSTQSDSTGHKKTDSEVISSIIDKTMTLTGEVNFNGKTRIDGIIYGDVQGEYLILSETGRIEGNIYVELLNCYGHIVGNIVAEVLTIRKGCNVRGMITANSLTVEPGAVILGEVRAGQPEDAIGQIEHDNGEQVDSSRESEEKSVD